MSRLLRLTYVLACFIEKWAWIIKARSYERLYYRDGVEKLDSFTRYVREQLRWG